MKWKILNQNTSRADIYTEKESFIATVPAHLAGLFMAAPEMLELLEQIKTEAILNADACDHELLSKIETVIKKAKG